MTRNAAKKRMTSKPVIGRFRSKRFIIVIPRQSNGTLAALLTSTSLSPLFRDVAKCAIHRREPPRRTSERPPISSLHIAQGLDEKSLVGRRSDQPHRPAHDPRARRTGARVRGGRSVARLQAGRYVRSLRRGLQGARESELRRLQ